LRDGTHKTIPFTASEYGPVYNVIMGLAKAVEGVTYHEAKFAAARQQWAMNGM
jgi:hypothetical protein